MRAGGLCLCAIVLLGAIVLLAGAGTAEADEWVPGYTAANGAYVPGHWESDNNPANNYSNLPNVNPYAARPRPKPADNYGAYDDPTEDGSDIGEGDSGDGGDGDASGDDGD
jgi:hypothetical protein